MFWEKLSDIWVMEENIWFFLINQENIWFFLINQENICFFLINQLSYIDFKTVAKYQYISVYTEHTVKYWNNDFSYTYLLVAIDHTFYIISRVFQS